MSSVANLILTAAMLTVFAPPSKAQASLSENNLKSVLKSGVVIGLRSPDDRPFAIRVIETPTRDGERYALLLLDMEIHGVGQYISFERKEVYVRMRDHDVIVSAKRGNFEIEFRRLPSGILKSIRMDFFSHDGGSGQVSHRDETFAVKRYSSNPKYEGVPVGPYVLEHGQVMEIEWNGPDGDTLNLNVHDQHGNLIDFVEIQDPHVYTKTNGHKLVVLKRRASTVELKLTLEGKLMELFLRTKKDFVSYPVLAEQNEIRDLLPIEMGCGAFLRRH